MIHSEYYLKEKSIVFQRGSLLDAFDEYHELVNPFVMKKEIQKKSVYWLIVNIIERKYMSRTTPTILCNLCMVEDLEMGK